MHTKNFIITGLLSLLGLLLIVMGGYALQLSDTNESMQAVTETEALRDMAPGEEQSGVGTERRAFPTENTPAPVGKIKADVFIGTLDAVDTGCFADGECFVEVGGKHVTAIMGWSQETVGTIQGADSFGDLEKYIGKQVEVYAHVLEDGSYTLYGSEGFYIKLLGNKGASATPRTPASTDACVIGGCSGQVCGEAAAEDGMVTTCEYRAEYACYKEAVCERQATGVCGWTETPTLRACLNAGGTENL